MPYRFKVALPSRLNIIQMLRGIAALMISIIHFDRGFVAEQNLRSGFSLGWSGVCTFFIISGFVLPYGLYRSQYSIKNFKKFIWKRIVRIEPPYIASILLILLMSYFIPSLVGDFELEASKNISAILGHFIYLNAFTGERWLNMVYWTLAVEFQFYLLIGLTFPIFLKSERYQAIIIFLLLSLAYFISPHAVRTLPFYFNFFLLGIVLFQYLTGHIRQKFFVGAMLTLFAFTWWRTGIGTTLFAMWVCGMIFYFYERRPENRFLLFMGEISYSFYLIHGPVDMALKKTFNSSQDNQLVNLALMLVHFSMALLVSYLFYLLIEKRFRKMASLSSNHCSTQMRL